MPSLPQPPLSKAHVLVGGVCALAVLLTLTVTMGKTTSELILSCPTSAPTSSPISDQYLRLLANALTGILYRRDSLSFGEGSQEELSKKPFNLKTAFDGADWPGIGHTMVGCRRLANIRALLESVMQEKIPGDFLEAGVWRGGSSIYARAVLDINGDHRLSHVCDSFEGLPPSSNAIDTNHWSRMKFLRVSREEVEDNFRAYDLLSDRVRFHKGYFQDSLPSAAIERLSIIRADGDMYESTLDILFNLYGKLSVGGYVIIDDWSIPVAQKGVRDFAKWHDFSDEIDDRVNIDRNSIYWRKRKDVEVKLEIYNAFNAKRAR